MRPSKSACSSVPGLVPFLEDLLGQLCSWPASSCAACSPLEKKNGARAYSKWMASCSRLCHAGQLLNFGCRIESGSWRRACSKCIETYSEGLEIPAGRCRLLTESCGTFGGGRNFFVAWSTPMGPIDGVRALKLKASDHMLLVFVEESVAIQCEEGLPKGSAAHHPPAPCLVRMHYRCACPCAAALIRVEGEIVTLRMCAGSKSFCHIDNFASEGSRTCGAHLSWPAAADGAKGGGRKRGRTAPPPVKAAPGAPVAPSPPHPCTPPPQPTPSEPAQWQRPMRAWSHSMLYCAALGAMDSLRCRNTSSPWSHLSRSTASAHQAMPECRPNPDCTHPRLPGAARCRA